MKLPTREEVRAEIVALKGQLDRVRRFSMFGDDNRAKIQAQIDVLENDYDDGDIECSIAEDQHDAAYDARWWLDGDGENGKPSEQWEPLCG